MFTNTTPTLNDLTGTLEVDWAGLRGDTWDFTVAKTGLAGYEGYIWMAQIRINQADADPVKAFTVTNNSDSNNVSVYFLMQTDDVPVASYFYDVQYVSSGATPVTRTIFEGKVRIRQDTTRTAP